MSRPVPGSNRVESGRFVCSIVEKGAPRRYGPQSYESFDEARRAAQARLRQLVFEWELVGS